MKNLKEYLNNTNTNANANAIDININENKAISIGELSSQYDKVKDLNTKNDNDVNKIHDVAMNALDVYFEYPKWDKEINNKIYDAYKTAVGLQLFKKEPEKAAEIFLNVISKVLDLVK